MIGDLPVPLRVMIVDDSAVVRGGFGRIIDAQSDMRVVTTASTGKSALDALRNTEIDVVVRAEFLQHPVH